MEEFITKKGFEQLKKELYELKNVKKWEIAEWLRETSSQGDMDENAEYVSAIEAQTALRNRVEELERRIRSAKIITKRRKDVVDVGSVVHCAASSKKMKFTVVGSEEADAASGIISTSSPLGRALFGKKPGDIAEVITPKGKKKYKITKIA
ncbi:MAG: transcription elongation factor GreA [Candidatus Spechtbacterales bacterium]